VIRAAINRASTNPLAAAVIVNHLQCIIAKTGGEIM
jgi:hypothetical protein